MFAVFKFWGQEANYCGSHTTGQWPGKAIIDQKNEETTTYICHYIGFSRQMEQIKAKT